MACHVCTSLHQIGSGGWGRGLGRGRGSATVKEQLFICQTEYFQSQRNAHEQVSIPPFLFTLYTTDFNYCTETCHLQKFSDDSAILGCISEGVEGEFRTTVDNFFTWCERNHLQLNVTETNELVVDLRRTKMLLTPFLISGTVWTLWRFINIWESTLIIKWTGYPW